MHNCFLHEGPTEPSTPCRPGFQGKHPRQQYKPMGPAITPIAETIVGHLCKACVQCKVKTSSIIFHNNPLTSQRAISSPLESRYCLQAPCSTRIAASRSPYLFQDLESRGWGGWLICQVPVLLLHTWQPGGPVPQQPPLSAHPLEGPSAQKTRMMKKGRSWVSSSVSRPAEQQL